MLLAPVPSRSLLPAAIAVLLIAPIAHANEARSPSITLPDTGLFAPVASQLAAGLVRRHASPAGPATPVEHVTLLIETGQPARAAEAARSLGDEPPALIARARAALAIQDFATAAPIVAALAERPEAEARAIHYQWEYVSYRVIPSLQIGVELNLAAGEVGPIATWFVLTESAIRPAAFLGTSSDRIGSPKGTQSYYLTAAKNLDPLTVSVYGTLNYSEWDNGMNLPFGANIEVLPGITLQPMYDGHRSHLLGVYSANHYSLTVIYAWLERIGLAASVGF